MLTERYSLKDLLHFEMVTWNDDDQGLPMIRDGNIDDGDDNDDDNSGNGANGDLPIIKRSCIWICATKVVAAPHVN